MNTPAHLRLGAAALAEPDRRGTTLAALLGALAPDLSLYILGSVSLFILQIPPQVVFDELYFSDAWQTVFAIDNSFVVWGAAFALALWLRHPIAIVFTAAALLHLATDFPLHTDDARPHFWPLTDWRFESPVSYWDSAHGARWVAPVEGLSCLGLTVILWRRYPEWGWRALWLGLLAMELYVIRSWLLFF